MTTPDPVRPAAGASGFRARRRRDWMIAAAIALVLIVAGGLVYLNSDIRAVESQTADGFDNPEALARVPDELRLVWDQASDVAVGSVASPYGTVVTTDQHAVVGRDVATGDERWRYSRSNRSLCAVGSGDTEAGDITSGGAVRGVLALYERNGYCGEMVLLDPQTGERRYQRTSPNQAGGTLFFGGPYAGWLGTDLAELWRYDLYRTIQYGDQPASKDANSSRTGCTFTDAAVTDDQWATVEHCAKEGENARVVLHWSDPNAENDDWSEYRSDARMEVDTGSPDAVIVGITKDRVSVLVADPSPAVLTYDADGTLASRTPAQIPAAAVRAAAATGAPTPHVTLDGIRYSLIDGHLIALGTEVVQVEVTVTESTDENGDTVSGDGGSDNGSDGDSGGDSNPDSDSGTGVFDRSATESTGPSTTKEDRDSPQVRWVLDDVIGLPAAIGEELMVPTAEGLAVVPSAEGVVSRTIAVDRPNGPARVDVSTVGKYLVESRGDQVAVLEGAVS